MTTPPPSNAASAGPYAVLRLRDYRLYLIGGILAAAGNQMLGVAVGWEVYHRTDSSLALGLVGLVQVAPILSLSLLAGHAADRYDRRRIVLAMQSVLVCTTLGLAAVSFRSAPIGFLFALLLVAAIARAFLWPARVALLPLIVPRESLANAITWSSSGFQIASVAGPTLAGAIIAWTGTPGWVYLCASGSALVFAASILFIRARWPARASEPPTFRHVVAGFRFLWNTRLLLAAMTLDLFAVLLGGATALLPVYARDILLVGPRGFGWLRAAPALGSLVMGLSLAHRPPIARAGRALLCGVAGFGLATIAFGWSTSYPLSLLLLAACGACDNVSVVVRQTLIQLRTPDEMRGRVAAVNTLFISCSNELGEFESGLVAHGFGPVASVVSGGIGTLLVVLAVAGASPELRRLGPLYERKES